MATTQLVLYNIALFAVGERALASTSEERESTRLLNEVWTRGAGGAVGYALEQGQWSFAARTSLLTVSTSVTPTFGFTYAFAKPTDLVRIVHISTNAELSDDLLYYRQEAGNYYSNSSLLYLDYISDSTSYGNDLTLWPETFTMWMGHWLASQIAPRLKSDLDLADLTKRTDELLVSARLKDTAQKVDLWPPTSFDTIRHRQLDHVLELMKLTPRQAAKEER